MWLINLSWRNIGFFVLTVALIGVFGNSSTVKAASNYDQAVKLYSPLVLIDHWDLTEGDTKDFSNEWFIEALEASRVRCELNQDYCDTYNDLDRLDSPNEDHVSFSVVVQKTSVNDPHAWGFFIVYSFSESAKAQFEFDNITDISSLNVVDPADSTNIKSTGRFTWQPQWGNPSGTAEGLYLTSTSPVISSPFVLSSSQNNFANYIFLSTFPVTYPENYNGTIIPDTTNPDDKKTKLVPDFSYSVDESGNLKVTYLKNLPHFLTGAFYWKIDQTTENWTDLEQNITIETIQPAGWMDDSYQLPEHGYYRFDISHNQQLDSPPWDEGDDDRFRIDQVWIEIYWNGNLIEGSTVGCGGSMICNQITNPDNLPTRVSNSITPSIGGISDIIIMPVNLLASLPARVGNCSPIQLSFLEKNISWPCLSSSLYSQGWFSNLWTIWQVTITGATIWLVTKNSLGLIQRLTRPGDDRIEVVNL